MLRIAANLDYRRHYIQSVLNLDTDKKREQEKRPLHLIGDSFKKVVIVNKVVKPYMDDDGIFTMGRSASCEFGQFRLGVTESVLIGTKGYHEQQ